MKKRETGNKIMTIVQCTICGMDMDCPESMMGLLVSVGMPPEFLDEVGEGMKGAKRRMGEGK